LLQPDGRVLVAGSFEMFDGVPRAGLARLESDGSLDVGFDPGNIAYPELTMGSSAVTALALARHGRILVGGIFTEINGVPRNRLARLNPDGSLDGGFDSQLGGWDVRVLAEEETGQVLIGGMFTDVDGIFRPGLARLNGGVFGFEFESVKLLANARARLNFEMPRGQRWFIEGSSDLMNWMVINPTRPLLDIDEFTDTSTPANEKRFYRAVKVP
jgi:hypothetical protein